MIFQKKELQKMVFEESQKLQKVEEWVSETLRWSIRYGVVFKNLETNKYYISYYSVGATKCQDEEPYEFCLDKIDCKEVIQKEVVVKKWVEV